jgi:hypothetical protein
MGLWWWTVTMLEADEFRKCAEQITRKARELADPNEARRLMSIANYWSRLADNEEWGQGHATGSSAKR